MKQKLNVTLATAAACLLVGVAALSGQESDITVFLRGGDRVPRIAVTDFRGTGGAQALMNTFNETVWNDLADAGVFDMVAKSVYPLDVPQQTSDFRPPITLQPAKVGDPPEIRKQGPWLTDWSGPPVNADYLAFGYAAERGGGLVVYGHFFNVRQPDQQMAQIFVTPYVGTLDQAGALKTAHEYAADILRVLGVPSLAGTKIWFVSDRTGAKEIWSMDPDGKNQQQFTRYGTSAGDPAVSADGKMLAFRVLAKDDRGEHWQIRVHSTETGARLVFNSPRNLGTVTTPTFSPDGKEIYYAANIADWVNLVKANVNGSNLQRLSAVSAVEVSPQLNPKTGTEMLFTSGRGGPPQVWRSSITGGGLQRVTDGTGQAGQPAWSPDGQHIAFTWTRGYEIGGYNIFVADLAKPGDYVQLTKGGAVYEHPSWAPDGLHLVYSVQRGRSTQIYSMLANGTRNKQLTSQGNNIQPVWANQIK